MFENFRAKPLFPKLGISDDVFDQTVGTHASGEIGDHGHGAGGDDFAFRFDEVVAQFWIGQDTFPMSYGVFVFGICDYITGRQKTIKAHEGREVFLSGAAGYHEAFEWSNETGNLSIQISQEAAEVAEEFQCLGLGGLCDLL